MSPPATARRQRVRAIQPRFVKATNPSNAFANKLLYFKSVTKRGGFAFDNVHLRTTDGQGRLCTARQVGNSWKPGVAAKIRPGVYHFLVRSLPVPPGVDDWTETQRVVFNGRDPIGVWESLPSSIPGAPGDATSPRDAQGNCTVCARRWAEAQADRPATSRTVWNRPNTCHLISAGGPDVQLSAKWPKWRQSSTNRSIGGGPWGAPGYGFFNARSSRFGGIGCRVCSCAVLAWHYCYRTQHPNADFPDPKAMNEHLAQTSYYHRKDPNKPKVDYRWWLEHSNRLPHPAKPAIKRRNRQPASISVNNRFMTIRKNRQVELSQQHRLLTKIDELLDMEVPVIVDVMTWTRNLHLSGQHYLTVVGRKGGRFVVCDSGWGRKNLDYTKLDYTYWTNEGDKRPLFRALASVCWLEVNQVATP